MNGFLSARASAIVVLGACSQGDSRWRFAREVYNSSVPPPTSVHTTAAIGPYPSR